MVNERYPARALGQWPIHYPVDVPDGCVLYLDPNNASLSRAVDHSGLGNHATVYGCTFGSAAYGQTFVFDGTDDYNQWSDNSFIDNITESFTIIAVLKPASDAKTESVFGGTQDSGLFFYKRSTTPYWYVRYNPDGTIRMFSTSTMPLTSQYNIIIVSYDIVANKALFTINGKTETPITPTTQAATRNVGTIKFGAGDQGYYSGQAGYIILLDRATTAAEHQHLYQSLAWRYGLPV